MTENLNLETLAQIIARGGGMNELFGPLHLYKYLWLGQYATDPDTTYWTTAEAGRLWYNTTINLFKYWNGTSIQTLGGAGSLSPDDRDETVLETLSGVVAWGRRIIYSATAPTDPEPRDIWLEPIP